MREVLEDVHLREPNVIEPPCEEAMRQCAAQKIDLFESAARPTSSEVSAVLEVSEVAAISSEREGLT